MGFRRIGVGKVLKRRRQCSSVTRKGTYYKGRVDEAVTLSTLAATTLIGANFDDSVVERTRISSLVVTATMVGYTPSTGDGPIEIGVAHSDYSDAEIEAWVESVATWDVGNLVETREVGKRFIRSLGQFTKHDVDQASPDSLWGGGMRKIRLNWPLQTGETLKLWAYNHGSSALATTSPVVFLSGHANLWLI